MKKIICLILCVLLSGVLLVGCGLFEHNYERDYRQVIATIDSFTQQYKGERTVLDSNGLPARDVEGNIEKEPVETSYTSPKVEIYKSQLVNYVNYYINENLNNGETVEKAIEGYMDTLISTELLLIEADKLFDAKVLYWTEADVEDIQRSVYTAIGDEIFAAKNALLKADGQPELPAKGSDPATGETTYPTKPEEPEEVYSPAFITENDGSHQWFDSWYLDKDTKWYIQESNFDGTYPGMYGGTIKDKSLAIEAFTNYLETVIENSKTIIGVTDAQKKIIEADIAEINKIRDTRGVAYVYPMLGKTLMMKLMLGNSYVKNAKLTKLQAYVTELTKVEESDVNEYYNNLLKSQKERFKITSNYDSAVSGNETILYTPSDRYVFVKHILLPFSEAQTAQLNKIKANEGNKDVITAQRAKLAKEITVYKHVGGEDDTSKKYTVADVTAEITAEMNRYKNNARRAERAFDDFIYMYNTDPGIFGSEKGYSVVYDLKKEGDSETYMVEFAEAAREFRRNDKYSIGHLYEDEETGVPYVITDYGIHIMYYSLDYRAGDERGLLDYTTPAQYTRIYDLMRTAALEKARSDTYSAWESKYLKSYKEEHSTKQDKLLDKYVKELNKLIYG